MIKTQNQQLSLRTHNILCPWCIRDQKVCFILSNALLKISSRFIIFPTSPILLINYVKDLKTVLFLRLPKSHNSICFVSYSLVTAIELGLQELQS